MKWLGEVMSLLHAIWLDFFPNKTIVAKEFIDELLAITTHAYMWNICDLGWKQYTGDINRVEYNNCFMYQHSDRLKYIIYVFNTKGDLYKIRIITPLDGSSINEIKVKRT